MCGLIGFDREARDQAAGLRTHIILGVGAALFTLVSAYVFGKFRDASRPETSFDPTRIAAQIVSGVSFLGAVAILRYGNDVRGVHHRRDPMDHSRHRNRRRRRLPLRTSSVPSRHRDRDPCAPRPARAPRTIMSRLRIGFAVMEISFKDGGDAASRRALETLDRHGIRVRSLDVGLEGEWARYSISGHIPPRQGVQATLSEILRLSGVELLSLNGLNALD